MKESFALIIVLGLIGLKLSEKFKLPGLLGMLLVGIFIGPSCFSLLDPSIISISTDFRLMSLIIILLRAGLGIDRKSLKEIGRPALRLSFLPGLIEGLVVGLGSIKFLGFTFIQGSILGFILAAVSPAVVVPAMIDLMEKGLGKDKHIPTMILSGASMDDVFAITMFTSFMALYNNSNANILKELFKIPLSIGLGVALGLLIGFGLYRIFKLFKVSLNEKVLIVFAVSILFTYLEKFFSVASLIGVMVIGFYIANKDKDLGGDLSRAFNNIWTLGQILLFVLIGASVDVNSLSGSLGLGAILIFLGLMGRSLGVYLSLLGTDLTLREKIFCIIAYIPKATVQAAIGGLPLASGVKGGEIILSISVLSILITAPLGSILINKTGKRLLD